MKTVKVINNVYRNEQGDLTTYSKFDNRLTLRAGSVCTVLDSYTDASNTLLYQIVCKDGITRWIDEDFVNVSNDFESKTHVETKPTVDKLNFNELADKAYNTAASKGFHNKGLPVAHYIGLVISEMGEAVSALQKGRLANIEMFASYTDNKELDTEEVAKLIKGTFEEELADIAIRLLDIAGLIRNIDSTFNEASSMPTEPSGKARENGDVIKLSFTEYVPILAHLVTIIDKPKLEVIHETISALYGWCDYRCIPLSAYIIAKMEYNESRIAMHGKLF